MAKRILVVALFCFTFWISVNAAPLTSALTHVLSNLDVTGILANCKRKPGGCNSQSDKAKNNRAAVKESLTRNLGEGHMPGMSADQAERLLQGTLSIKNTLLLVNKLTGVVGYDNGLYGGDRVIKSQTEIDTMLGRLKGTLPSLDADLSLPVNALVPLVGNALGRKKRADALSLDYYRGNKWPSNTINVFIDPKIFSASEAAIIRDALKSISSAVGCITFVEKAQDPYIEFVKTPKGTDSGTCGWSSVGYQKGQRNDVNLNFDSSICRPAIKGVVVHETCHALAFTHEHTRNDRDNSITITNNVDPQSLDVFDKDDPNDYNPYGKEYDLKSIMHYDQYVGAADSSKPSFTLKKHPEWASQVGNGDKMTDVDASLMKRLYCGSPTCRDAGPNCGWKALTEGCSKISTSCPKSCGACDKTSG